MRGLRRIQQWYTARIAPDASIWPWWLPEFARLRWQSLLWASIGYALLTVVWTWPMAVAGQQGVLVPPWSVAQPDVSQNVWNVWHFANTWMSGQPLLTTALFFPQQINLMYQSYGFSQSLLVAPVVAMWGPVVGANMILAWGYWGGALGMFFIIWSITKRPLVAFLVGWMYVITPAHQFNVAWAADENAALQWLVLLHLSIVWWLRQPRGRRLLAPLTALLINTLASGYFGLFGAVYMGLLVLWSLWYRWVPAWQWRVLWQAVIVAGAWVSVAIVLLAPPLAEYAYSGTTQVAGNPLARESDLTLEDWYMRQTIATHVVAVSDLVVPTQEQPWWRLVAPDVEVRGSQMGGYVGWSVIVLLVWSAWRLPAVRPMLALGGVLVILAAGLEVRVWPNQPFAALPGPFWLFNVAAVFRNASRPGLFLLWAWLPLLFVVARGLLVLPQQRAMVLIALLVWGEFAPMTWTLSPQQASPVATVLQQAPEPGAVLYLPFDKNGARPLIDQVCHGRASATGYLARVPGFATSMRVILREPDVWQDVIPVQPVVELANLGVRYVVVSAGTPEASVVALRDGGATVYREVGSETIWQIPDVSTPALLPGAGWWDPEQSQTTRWRWSTAQSHVQIVAQHDAVVRIALTVSRMDEGKPLAVWLNGERLTTLAVPAMPVMLDRVLVLPVRAGMNDVTFVTDTSIDPVGRAIGVSFSRLEIVRSTSVLGGNHLPDAPTYAHTWLCPAQ